MKLDINLLTLEIPCPHCAHKISKTVRQLKTLTELPCNRCGTRSALDKAQIAGEVARLQRQVEATVNKGLGQLGGAIRRLGK